MRSAGVPTARALIVAAVLAVAASACSSAAAPSATGAAGGSGAGSGAPAPGGQSTASTRPGTWTTVHVPATAVASGERTVLVYTPGVAHPDQLPVVYLLHGEPGQPSDLCDAGVGSALDAVFRSGVAPFVLACPDGNDDDVDDTEWADSADGRSQVETFVTGPLITAVEGGHRRPRGLRAIAGFSMGGYGAAMLALRHPDLYSQVATLAGYFTIDDPDQVFGGSPSTQASHNPTDLVGVASQLRWLLLQAAGDDLPLTAHASATYASLLEAHGASVDLRTTSGGHTGSWARAQLPAVARFFAAGWARS